MAGFSNYPVDTIIDISSETCPITFVRTKLALEKMNSGQILKVILSGGEPSHNVPRAVQDHGHEILEMTSISVSLFELLIKVR